jgi:DNA-binding transcriptional regulator YiaG
MVRPKRTKITTQDEAIRIRKLRLSLGMTTRAYGKFFGISHSTVTQWENGKTEIPEIAIKLLHFFEKEHADKLKKKP